MFDYFKKMSNSERNAILAGSVVVAIVLVYQVIFSPLHRSIEQKTTLLHDKNQTLEWMYEAATEYQQLRRSKPLSRTSHSNESLLTIIDQATVKLDIRSFIRRIDPEGKDQVQFWLERINFDDMIQLLNILKRNHDINVIDLSVNRQSDSALVDARITVKGRRP